MPNEFGKLAPREILAQELLDDLKAMLFPITAFTTKFSTEAIAFGQSVIAHVANAAAAQNFGDGAKDTGSKEVPVKLDRMREIHETFTYAELSSQSGRNVIRERYRPQLEAIAADIVSGIASVITPENFPKELVKAAVDFDYRHLVQVRKDARKTGIRGSLGIVANGDAYAELLSDDLIINGQRDTKLDGVITSGYIRPVAGFNSGIHEYPDLPETNNLVGFAASKAAIAVVTAPPHNPQEDGDGGVSFPGKFAYVTEPETGFTVALVEHINPDTLKRSLRMIFQYGVAVGNADTGIRLVSAPTGS